MAPEAAASAGIRSRFFANGALLMLALVVTAFLFTYFRPLVTGRPEWPGAPPFSPLHHIHGAFFFSWMGLYAWQTQLVASGRLARHREFGLAGIAISALMLPLGLLLTIKGIVGRIGRGDPDPYFVTLFNVVDIATFSVLMTVSIASVTRHIDWHRRFTFGAALSLVGASISRWFLPNWPIVLPRAPPWTDMAPNLLADLLLMALLVHDRRTLGRVHPATWGVIALLVPLHVATPYLAETAAWRRLAPGLLRLW